MISYDNSLAPNESALPIILANIFGLYSTLIMAEKREAGVSNLDCQPKSSLTDNIQINLISYNTLIEATLRQKPKLWTKRMFKVSRFTTLNYKY